MMKKIAALAATILSTIALVTAMISPAQADSDPESGYACKGFTAPSGSTGFVCVDHTMAFQDPNTQFLKKIAVRVENPGAVASVYLHYLRVKNQNGDVKWSRNNYTVVKDPAGQVYEAWTPGQRVDRPAEMKIRYQVYFNDGSTQIYENTNTLTSYAN